MDDIQFEKMLKEEGYIAIRKCANGVWIGVSCQLYTYGLCVGLDEWGYGRRYCYRDLVDVLVAAETYEGEGDPSGPWIKVKGEGVERLGPGAKGEI